MPKAFPFAPKNCTLCPRQCHADRASGRVGFCGAGGTLKAARAALHFWEEPCISGTRGSGTVFFSGCTLKCCFCQNYPHQRRGAGQRDHGRASGRDLPQPSGAGGPQHQPCHPRPVAAVDHRGAGRSPRQGAAPAHRLQHRRLRNAGQHRALAGVHRYLAGRPEICFLFPLGGAFRCTGLFRGGESGH